MTWTFKATGNKYLKFVNTWLHSAFPAFWGQYLVRISWLVSRHLIAIICHPRLVGVEMTYASASFGEPIKDGLSCRCRTEGERKIAGAAKGRRAKDRDQDFGSKKKRVFSYGGCKVEDKRGETPSLCLWGRSHSGDTQMWATRTKTTQVQR